MKTASKKATERLLTEIPPVPEGMKELAATLWKLTCQVLKDEKRLTEASLSILKTYTELCADMQRCREEMDNAWGSDRFARYQKSYNDSAKLQLAYARELGLTAPKTSVTKEKKRHILDGLD